MKHVRSSTSARVVWGLLALLTCCRPCARAEDTGQREQVLRFLQRLGLEELEALHVENVLQQPLEPDAKIRWAKQLADLYAQQLMHVEGSSSEAATLQAKIEQLVRRIPQADNAALQVMLLQADYNQAETQATRWLADRTLTAARTQAAEILTRVTPRLHEYRRQLQAEVDRVMEQLNEMPDGDLRETRERELQRQQAALGRAAYFAGWSSYYLAQVGSADPQPQYEQAQETFRELLGIGDTPYVELDAEWMQLESDWRCRAVIGLALTEAGLGDLEASRICCGLLEHASVPPVFQDQSAYWYMQGLLNAGRWEDAHEAARELVEGFRGKATQGKFSLCVSLVRAGFGAGREEDPDRQDLGLLGLQGLSRLGRQAEVRELVDQYGISLDHSQEFLLRWIGGQRLLAEAADSKLAQDYRNAADALQAALDCPDATEQVSAAGACRFELAWCQFQLGEYDAAGKNFAQSVVGLKASDRTRAAQAAWSAYVAYQKLLDTQPRYRSAAISVLETLTRDFPSDPLAPKAELQLRKLKAQGQPPEATIAGLEQVSEDDPTFAAARLEICLLRHRLWSEADPTDRPRAANALLTSCDQLLEIDPAKLTTSQILRAELLAAEVLLAAKPPAAADLRRAATYLDNAAGLVQRLSENHSMAAEYHYRRMQLAGASGDDVGRRQHADWLLEHARESAYELPALVVAARYLDRAVTQSGQGESTAALQQAYDVYERLTGKLGTTAQQLSAQKNARVCALASGRVCGAIGAVQRSRCEIADALESLPEGS